MNRESRIQIAKDTLKILERGYYTNKDNVKVDILESLKSAVRNTMLYSPCNAENLEIISDSPENYREYEAEDIEVTNEGTIDSVLRLSSYSDKLACLNFASAKNPGGGFLNGSQAQEESLTRASGLFPCINQMQEMYNYNRSLKTCLYSDYMIFTKNVPVIRDANDELLETFVECSVITAPAVNAGVIKQREPENIPRIEDVMGKRIRMILNIALVNGIDTLILGAWGCGVFQNDPELIAGLFAEQLNNRYKKRFRKVVFSILDSKGHIIEAFSKHLKP